MPPQKKKSTKTGEKDSQASVRQKYASLSMETYWEELDPFKSQSLKTAYWQTDLPLQEFCTVEPPSPLHWGPVLKNINNVNLRVKTCQRYPPMLVVLKCRTQDYTSKHTDSVGGFLLQIPRDIIKMWKTWRPRVIVTIWHENTKIPLAVRLINTNWEWDAWFISQSLAEFEKRKKKKVYIHLNKTLLFTMEKKNRFLRL